MDGRIAFPRRYSPEQLKRIASFSLRQKERLAGITIRQTLCRTMKPELDELSERIRSLVSSPDFVITL